VVFSWIVLALMDHLKRVSVRIDYESSLVSWDVMWAQARRAVIDSTSLQGRRVNASTAERDEALKARAG
jgi:hypothetical protein